MIVKVKKNDIIAIMEEGRIKYVLSIFISIINFIKSVLRFEIIPKIIIGGKGLQNISTAGLRHYIGTYAAL